MKPFEESDRLNFPLTKESVVLEVGAYKGEFTELLDRRFGCNIYSFEPVHEFYVECCKKFKNRPNIRMLPNALGASERTVKMGVKGDSSGEFVDGGISAEVQMRDIVWFFGALDLKKVDLIVINCEGGEYELLERMIESGLIKQCENVCVQFHTCVRDAAARRLAIMEKLVKTHLQTFCEPWVWEGWKRDPV